MNPQLLLSILLVVAISGQVLCQNGSHQGDTIITEDHNDNTPEATDRGLLGPMLLHGIGRAVNHFRNNPIAQGFREMRGVFRHTLANVLTGGSDQNFDGLGHNHPYEQSVNNHH